MKRATFVFGGDLNSFLPLKQRAGTHIVNFKGSQSVKHLIEASGVPHTEVAQVRANHECVDFNYIVEDNDLIEVLPFLQFDNSINPSEGNIPDDQYTRFILDNHLGKLTGYLRMLGFDCAYDNSLADEALAELGSKEDRILLTRDRRLLMRKIISNGYCVRSLNPEQQVQEVLVRFNLASKIQPFKRCIRCNHMLEPISKAEVNDRLQPLTRKYFDEFQYCPSCNQIYWKGSHYENMLTFIDKVKHTTR